MLKESWRDALAAVRRAGWRAALVGVGSYAPLVAAGAVGHPYALVAGLVLHVVMLVALVRVLGASRPEPLPPLPEVDDQGRRVATPAKPGPPTTAADRSPFTAIRNAWRLLRPAVSLTGLVLLAQAGAAMLAVVLSGGRLGDYGYAAQSAAVMPLAALFMAFVALAIQRVALEGDPRVLVAAAHSVRIAKTTYGVLLLLTLAEPLVLAGVVLASRGDDLPTSRVALVGVLGIAALSLAKILVAAVSNEVYLRGARLDLPLDPAR